MPKPSPPATSSTPRRTRFAAFSPEDVHRSLIKGAPYNPRELTDAARKRLRANIERVGLLEPIIWNRTTGFVVGGHQRLKQLDALEGHPDYLVPVAVVELDAKTEKAQNVFLNNGEAQGDWDLALLQDVLLDIGDTELAGFSTGDVYQLFGTNVMADVPEYAEKTARENAELKATMQALDDDSCDREPAHFFLAVVFENDEARLAFTEACGLPDNRYVDGRRFLAVARPKPAEEADGEDAEDAAGG